MSDWCERYINRPIVAVLLQSVAKVGPMEVVAKHARHWLAVPGHVRILECAYLFRSLFRHRYPFELFSESLLQATQQGGTVKLRRDLCSRWLEWGGAPEKIEARLHEVIAEDPCQEQVRFALESWFNSTSGREAPAGADAFRPEMQAWLVANAAHPEASRVFNIWFALKLDLAPIALALRAWLNANPDDPRCASLLNHYARIDPAGADKLGASEEQVRAQLARMSGSLTRRDNIRLEGLLKSPVVVASRAGLHDQVLELVRRYLQVFGDEPDSAFLIGLVFEVVENAGWIIGEAERWLAKNAARGRAKLVYIALLRHGCDPARLHRMILDWLDTHPDDPRAAAVFLAWLEARGDRDYLVEAARRWLVHAHANGFIDADRVEDAYGL